MVAPPCEGPSPHDRAQASAHLEEEALLAHLRVPLLGHCNTRGSQVPATLSYPKPRQQRSSPWTGDRTPGDLYLGGYCSVLGESLPETTGKGVGRSSRPGTLCTGSWRGLYPGCWEVPSAREVCSQAAGGHVPTSGSLSVQPRGTPHPRPLSSRLSLLYSG